MRLNRSKELEIVHKIMSKYLNSFFITEKQIINFCNDLNISINGKVVVEIELIKSIFFHCELPFCLIEETRKLKGITGKAKNYKCYDGWALYFQRKTFDVMGYDMNDFIRYKEKYNDDTIFLFE